MAVIICIAGAAQSGHSEASHQCPLLEVKQA
jgi:hypothetical protein